MSCARMRNVIHVLNELNVMLSICRIYILLSETQILCKSWVLCFLQNICEFWPFQACVPMSESTDVLTNCGTNFTENNRVNLGMHEKGCWSWRPVATWGDTKGQTNFPRHWVVLASPTAMEALSGFLSFLSYAAAVSKVTQVQEWYESKALGPFQTIFC